ncbi:septum formation family protein [Streptomyces sp. NPDC058662]|uniref:DUF4190 domain-containing protein n=1 Tax=Streptomyces sp. NPDC058662 TaxID=3346583 RepID=UPI00364F0A1C
MSTPPSPPPGPGPSWPPPSPQYGWGPPPGHGRPPQPPLNGLAPASLLVGLLCLPPLGVVLAVVALAQIARKRERGRALAVTGLAVSVAMTGVLALTAGRVVAAVGDRLDRAGAHTRVEGVLVDIGDLGAGDCFNVPGADLSEDRPLMYAVDCASPHHGEVTRAERLGPAHGPGTAEAARALEDVCWKAQDEYAMDTWALPAYADMYYFAPSRDSWRQGDRQLLCVIGTTERERRGSLRRDAGTLRPEQAAFLRAANAVDFVLGRPPDGDVDDALDEHRAWAREVYAALGEEARTLERERTRPGLEKAVQAQLQALETARAGWQRAARAHTAEEFEERWERAAGTLPWQTERDLRGVYGLSTTVPPWVEPSPTVPGEPRDPGEPVDPTAPGGGRSGEPGRGPSTEAV